LPSYGLQLRPPYNAAGSAKARFFTVQIRTKVTNAVAERLVHGAWHLVRVDMAQDGKDGLTIFAKVPLPRLAGNKPEMAFPVLHLPRMPVKVELATPLPLLQGVALNLYYGFGNTRAAAARSAPRPKTALVVTAAAPSVETLNVGQAGFHTFSKADGTPVLAYDAGYAGQAFATNAAKPAMLKVVAADAPIILSHWDMDHCESLTELETLPIQFAGFLVAPATGINTPTKQDLVYSFGTTARMERDSSGDWKVIQRLFLIGDWVSPFLTRDDKLKQAIGSEKTPAWIRESSPVPIPSNVTIGQTSGASWTARENPNNFQALYLTVTGANGTKVPFTGDASYRYVDPEAKRNLTHLEAVHHGSLNSLYASVAQKRARDPTGTDIPAPGQNLAAVAAPRGTVFYSYDPNDTYPSMGPGTTWPLYQARGWSRYISTDQVQDGEIKVAL
jgi:hypothetical protein